MVAAITEGLLWFLVAVFLPPSTLSFTYPMKRFGHSAVGRSPYIPIAIPVGHRYAEYQTPDYEDGYSPEDLEYAPVVPYYGYYPTRGKTDRRNVEGYGYYEDQPRNDPIDDIQEEMMEDERGKEGGYPYGQETWYENTPKYDNNAEANAAFLQNLIIAQMYQDAAANAAVNAGNPSRYAAAFPFVYTVLPNEDYDDHWQYGLPTHGVEEKERAREFFNSGNDEEVKELESLRKKNKKKQNKQKEGKKKGKGQKNKDFENMDDEVLREMRRNSRKNAMLEGEGLVVRKKQSLPFDGAFFVDQPEMHILSDRKGKLDAPRLTTAAPAAPTTVPPPRATSRPLQGQKEVVLPRPASPVRSFGDRMSIRSPSEPSVYDTIKRLLSMEQDLRKGDSNRPHKRFVSNEDQLTEELSGLKKLSA